MKIFVLSKDTLIVYSVVVMLLLGLITFGVTNPSIITSSGSGKAVPIYSVDTTDKKVALTFDAAWGDSDTQQLIDILGKYNVKVSIFVVGGWADRYPESVKAFHAAGHEILNHSDSHLHFNGLSAEEIASDVQNCEKKIQSLTGESKNLFRAPYGEYNDTVVKSARDAGFEVIQWDVEPHATVGKY
ncbi:MAG: polysaccharide deacetylase family protein [Clostridia bacterium]|nr:polysaccharide deacetylase family protein [Clostridia bacterium]